MRLYLLQRGTFKKDLSKETSKFSELIDLDYMGSAEFEFGALPASRIRMANKFDEYGLHEVKELASPNGVPFNLYCDKNEITNIVSEIWKYIQGNDPSKIVSYRLKERASLANKYYGFQWSVGRDSDNFWWDIENDFMCFYGAADRQNAFKRVVINNAMKETNEFLKTDRGREALYKALRVFR